VRYIAPGLTFPVAISLPLMALSKISNETSGW
jgi:hypothetical protein